MAQFKKFMIDGFKLRMIYQTDIDVDSMLTVYEEQLETKFSRETQNLFTLSLYYDVDGIGATPSSISVKETVVACSTVE